jgi:hypothetical protein
MVEIFLIKDLSFVVHDEPRLIVLPGNKKGRDMIPALSIIMMDVL